MTPPTLEGLLSGGTLLAAAAELGRRLHREGARRAGDAILRRDPAGLAGDLARALREERYVPSPSGHVVIAKASGGTRSLGLLAARDQVLHGALARALGPWLDRQFCPSSWAYRPRRSSDAAARHAARALRDGMTWAADLDVKDFFGTVPHAPLLTQLDAMGVSDPPLVGLIRTILRHGMKTPAPPAGLAQGSPLSPLLANVHLHPVDVAMEGLPGYQRYADDLVCMARSEDAADDAMERMTAAVRGRGLHPHPGKTAVRRIAEGWRYLGWTVEADGQLRQPERERPT